MGFRIVLVTDSYGLIAPEVCTHFDQKEFRMAGIDNNELAVFFGPERYARRSVSQETHACRDYAHFEVGVRSSAAVLEVVAETGQTPLCTPLPSPRMTAQLVFFLTTSRTKAIGTLNMLEAAWKYCPESPFVHMSTNKVYSDMPNSDSSGGVGDVLGICQRAVRAWGITLWLTVPVAPQNPNFM